MIINVNGGPISEQEKMAYVEYLQKKYNRKIATLNITIDGDEVELDYRFAPENFERIRRITGYLVGTMDRWNNAKAAEEKDRVKHSVSTAEEL